MLSGIASILFDLFGVFGKARCGVAVQDVCWEFRMIPFCFINLESSGRHNAVLLFSLEVESLEGIWVLVWLLAAVRQ